MSPVLIAGCGDIGRRIAAGLRDRYCVGIVRGGDSGRRLAAAGIAPLVLDLDGPISAAALPAAASELYYLAPPPPQGRDDARVARFLAAVEAAAARPRKAVYLSTSAVYGDCRGDWIDETAPLRPGTDRGHRRLDAERRMLDWSGRTGVPVVILRVPGIYGPGRLPLERIRNGLPVLSESDSPYTNRIHADDLAAVCIVAMARGRAGEAYNVSDGHPTTMCDYFERVARRAGLPPPPRVERAVAEQVLGPGMLSFLDESKRLKNDKLLTELNVRLQYTDLAAGLAAIDPNASD